MFEIHDIARRPSSGLPKPEPDLRRVVLVSARGRRRERCYRLHAGGPCVFTLRGTRRCCGNVGNGGSEGERTGTRTDNARHGDG